MPLITAINIQKRAAARFSVYIDESYSFSLSDLELSASSLRVGQALSPAEVTQWQEQAHEDKAYNLVLRYLSYRERSRYEVLEYLRRKDYAPEIAAGIVDRLQAAGLQDDARFAAAWVADRRALRPRSRRQLEQELLKKGVDRPMIAEAVAVLGGDEQAAVLDELVSRKRRQSQYQDNAKLMAYLGRQGFGYAEIKRALERPSD